MIYEGLVAEGLSVVKGVRDRHDGERRNPWNEFECGNYYSRSMASYSVLLALSGFHYSAPEKSISFAPVINQDDFACFFSVGSGWGMYSQKSAGTTSASIEVRMGELELKEICLPFATDKAVVNLAGNVVSADVKGCSSCDKCCDCATVTFSKPIKIKAGETLTIML